MKQVAAINIQINRIINEGNAAEAAGAESLKGELAVRQANTAELLRQVEIISKMSAQSEMGPGAKTGISPFMLNLRSLTTKLSGELSAGDKTFDAALVNSLRGSQSGLGGTIGTMTKNLRAAGADDLAKQLEKIATTSIKTGESVNNAFGKMIDTVQAHVE